MKKDEHLHKHKCGYSHDLTQDEMNMMLERFMEGFVETREDFIKYCKDNNYCGLFFFSFLKDCICLLISQIVLSSSDTNSKADVDKLIKAIFKSVQKRLDAANLSQYMDQQTH